MPFTFSLFDRPKALGMVYDETNTCKGEQQVDVQKMTIYRPQNHFKGTESLKDRQSSN